MEIKITKRQLLKEVNNDMAHNFYYLISGRIINDTKTKYKKFKIVLWFDIFDLQTAFDKDRITKSDINSYIENLIFSYTSNIDSYDNCQEFFDNCNETINRYNNGSCTNCLT